MVKTILENASLCGIQCTEADAERLLKAHPELTSAVQVTMSFPTLMAELVNRPAYIDDFKMKDILYVSKRVKFVQQMPENATDVSYGSMGTLWAAVDADGTAMLYFNNSYLADANQLFSGYDMLESVDLTGLDASNVHDFYMMFNGCSHLKELDLSPLKPNGLAHFRDALWECTELEHVRMPTIQGSASVDLTDMCSYCPNLRSVDFSAVDFECVLGAVSLFEVCPKLDVEKVFKQYEQGRVQKTYYWDARDYDGVAASGVASGSSAGLVRARLEAMGQYCNITVREK